MPFVSTFSRHDITRNEDKQKKTPFKDIQTKWRINKKKEKKKKRKIKPTYV